ncbi:hypothetical protein [Paenibacillus polymyxa]|uniref:hypothetical protein n=1 Tax=Paenibacillus polymyxa TaxID=1406 RepID=UPI002AB3CC67|nr:hypothetical protein [Paenibacillus polymyxa]MDY8021222.1 hypothetical protein [Paenibacillus polymyxa]
MGKIVVDYERLNTNLKRKANYFSKKIWGLNFTGRVEFCKGMKRMGEISYWNKKPLIRFKREMAKEELVFSLDDLLVYYLTIWYCKSKGLNKKADLKNELSSHGVCSKDRFFIANGKAYTGVSDRKEWEPTLTLIDFVIEIDN